MKAILRGLAAAAGLAIFLSGCSTMGTRKKPSKTYLNYYVVLGDTVEVNRLLENGVDPNAIRDATTPLKLAAWMGNNAMVDLLLRHSADVNKTDTLGATALMAAISGNRPETVKLLLDQGASLEPRLNDSLGILEIARFRDNPDILAELKAKGLGADSLRAKGFRGTPEILSLVLLYSDGLRVVYNQHLQRNRGLAGKIKTRFAIHPDGTVGEFSLESSKTRHPEFDRDAPADDVIHVPFAFSD